MARRDTRDVTGMQHRSPAAGCPLCPLWGVAWDPDDPRSWHRQHEHAARLWEVFDGTRRSAPAVAEVCRDLGVREPSPEEVMTHFLHHGVEQPAPRGSTPRVAMLALMERLAPRLQAVVDLVYRVRMVSTEQVAELLYRRGGDPPDLRRARADLAALSRAHLLYRYLPERPFPGHTGVEPIWMLGRNAMPWLEVRYPRRASGEHFVSMARQVGRNSLYHDWRANELCVEIGAQAAAADAHELGGGLRAAVGMSAANWWGPRHLAVSFHDRTNMREREVIPDGFVCLTARALAGAPAGLPGSWQLPLFVEFDRGSRPLWEVVDQLLAYHWLALSGAAGRRFPQLAVTGYAVPVLMIFRRPDRVREGRRRLLERAGQLGLADGTPILLVSEADLEAGLFAAERIAYAWDRNPERRFGLLEILQRTAQPLIESRRLAGHSTLTIDPDGARRRPGTQMPRPRRELAAAAARAALPAAPPPG